MRSKSNMTIETAKAIGAALGLWAVDEILARCANDDQRRYECHKANPDCVCVEESPVWEGFHEEWFGLAGNPDGHVNEPLYNACFDAMYASARAELKRRDDAGLYDPR